VFFREKKSGPRSYLQIVENRREGRQTRQQVIATLGRMDILRESGQLEGLLSSGARFSESLMAISAHKSGESLEVATRRIGPAMIFERLWQESGCREVMGGLLSGRHFEFSVERAIFLTVLHRLFDPGSDRQAERWREEYKIDGVEELQLHHSYRAMAWLGEELPMAEQCEMTRFAPRCTKDLIEEELFSRRRDLFSALELVFFDTTSIYFEGNGGQTVGELGNSKDSRPDCKQMVVGAVLDQEGNPVCCEMWPGNAADVKSLIPVVDRLRQRFGIGQVCIVADRGMISQETVQELESGERGWKYILGARMRKQKEVREEVLSVPGRYRVVHAKSNIKKDPSPLKVKDVVIDGRQYVVCLNEDQARKDAADREAILASLRDQLKRGDKSLVGNKGYRKYLKTRGKGFEIDEQKALEEARYDGKWVLRTNTNLSTDQVALKYKQLWMVESLFRTVKSILETRPIYHKRDETILGHVFCSFLSFVLMKELQNRVEAKGYQLEWADVIRDLNRLQEVEIEQDGKRLLLRSEATGTCGKVFQAAGVALPPTVRQAC
jgi:transposase